MTKYAYWVTEFNAYYEKQEFQDYLNKHAAKGWRVVSTEHPTNMVGIRVVFEREMPECEDPEDAVYGG